MDWINFGPDFCLEKDKQDQFQKFILQYKDKDELMFMLWCGFMLFWLRLPWASVVIPVRLFAGCSFSIVILRLAYANFCKFPAPNK